MDIERSSTFTILAGARKFAIPLFCSICICYPGVFNLGKKADIPSPYASHPLAAFGMPANPLAPAGIISAPLCVHEVLGYCSWAKVAQCVIAWVAINVVDVQSGGNGAVGHLPNDAVDIGSRLANSDFFVASLYGVPSNLSGKLRIEHSAIMIAFEVGRRTLSPSNCSRLEVCIEELCPSFVHAANIVNHGH